ncbi:hypothetical protein D9619_007132 [Psilocybe cf. subviscida]|uniref:glucan 1,4-alpha-glucosidase n=1 Tax=Psilocybe cf. subviscida TaxID=2480587 RepID=A0A8H5EWN3_9AGAR|nr:hypothetical protein D9619_007132 [Psilocybe cf. subviscida]
MRVSTLSILSLIVVAGAKPSVVDSYIAKELQIAKAGLLANIGPSGSKAHGAKAGLVVASPSAVNPNYVFTWTRDSALVFKSIIDSFTRGDDKSSRKLIDYYVSAQADIQQVTNPSGAPATGGLGEPKFNIDGTAFTEPWGRPQRDGPALRATALITYANWLLDNRNVSFVTTKLWPVIKLDLDYVQTYWNQTGFDLWEEVAGRSFFTTSSQHRALREGVTLAKRIGQTSSVAGYSTQAGNVLCFLHTYWNPTGGYITSNTRGGRSGIDANSALASIHSFDSKAGCDVTTFQPCSDKALSSLKVYVDSFRSVYAINMGIPATDAVATGRYSEDVYFGGNPWYLTTFAVAEQLYLALLTWKQEGFITVTDISLLFFRQFSPSIKTGKYTLLSPTYHTLLTEVKTFADGFVAMNAKYTPADGSLSEQFDRNTGAPLSAADLTWSYASASTAFRARDGVIPVSWGAKGLTIPSGECKSNPGPTVNATFNVEATTQVGESIYITGSIDALQSWSPDDALILNADKYPIWSINITLPASTNFEYKYIRKFNEQVTWEEIRQFVKDIGAALAYLKQENIIHRNICGTNTLISKGFQAKLCDFGHATQVGAVELAKKFIYATYPSPEILQPPYHCGFAMDMWAFGCLILSCLQESLPTTNALPLDLECQKVLSGHSQNFQDFVVSLLAMDPLERLSAENILQHPGLHEGFSGDDPSSSKTSSRLACYSSYGFSNLHLAPSSSLKSSTIHDQKGSSNVLKNVTNTKLRDYILKQSTDNEPPKPTTQRLSQGSFGIQETKKVSQAKRIVSEGDITPKPHQLETIPMGTTRPVSFNTNLLSAATHKLTEGSITVLPSLSVLVDFRENQRRNGFKGDHVLLINPKGDTIKVYSAPHLSIPSCLVESMETFMIDDLPLVYWKQYNDAASCINKIKRKTPQMTIHKSGAKCILMSNIPKPDVEIVMHSSYSSKSAKKNPNNDSPIIRIRYSRQNRSLELSEHSTGVKGPEWKKECLPCHELDTFTTTNNSRLSESCRIGLRLLTEFLETCERLNAQHIPSTTDPSLTSRPNSPIHNDGPLSLSSIRIPAKPRKYPLRMSTFSNKENLPALQTTQRHVSKETPPPPRPPPAIEDVLPDTRFMPGVGWCVRRPVIPASPKMKYQLMFDDGACLEVNFYSGILTLVPAHGGPVE